MNVIIANTFHYYRGGDCSYTFGLSDLLQKMGAHKVVHFAMEHALNLPSEYSEFFVPGIDFLEEMKKNKIKAGLRVLNRSIYSTVSKRKLSELLDKYTIDIAHIQNIHGHITPSIFHTLKARNIPIVWTLHDYFLLCPNSVFFSNEKVCEKCKKGKFFNVLIEKCRKDSYAASFVVMLEEYIHRLAGLLKLPDFFITPSQFLRKKLIEYGFPYDKVIHIPNFVYTKNVDISSSHNDYILYSGRLSYEKGIKTLIKAVSLCKMVKLLIAGDGPLREELESMAKDIAPDKIQFLGYLSREKLKEFIGGAMFIVVPSEWYENFPYAILESFVYRKPVIGSQIGGIPELIENGKTGLLSEPGNAEDLAEKIHWMLVHPKERQEMGKRARELVEIEYGPERHYERILEIYKKALKKYGKNV